MSDTVRLLVVNPGDMLRPEVETLTEVLSPEAFDLHVMIAERCRGDFEERPEVDYHYYPAVFLPEIRYTIPLPGFFRTFRSQSAAADVVHLVDYDYLPSFFGSVLASRSDTPVIMFTDALPGISWSYGSRVVDAVAYVYTHTLGRLGFYLSDKVVGPGEYLREGMERFTDESKVQVITRGVDTDYFTSDGTIGRGETVRLLFVGRLDSVKRVSTLLNAMDLLARNSTEEYELTLVGDGDQRAEYERLVEELDLGDCVEFEGWQNDVRDYYRDHDIFVLPSISEGLSTVLMEAQACGLPIVATRVGGAEELIGAGALVPTEDPDALAEGISKVADLDPSVASEQAREHVVENFSRERTKEEYVSLYRSLADR